MRDVEAIHAAGFARGGTLENALVVEGGSILSPGGARFEDEAVRHKMLDVIGDLSLMGAPIVGSYKAYRPSHALTNSLLRKFASLPETWRMEYRRKDVDRISVVESLDGGGSHFGEDVPSKLVKVPAP